MTENELDKSDYYLRKLELHKRFGKVFGKIPLPNGVPFYFQLFLFFVVFFIEVNIGSYFILPILANLYIMDVYYIVQTRKLVIDRCLIQEDVLEEDIACNTMDEKEWGPNRVINEDRDSIFDESLDWYRITPFWYYLKNSYPFLICSLGLSALFYGLFYLLNFYLR
jgi:hypothetical protein